MGSNTHHFVPTFQYRWTLRAWILSALTSTTWAGCTAYDAGLLPEHDSCGDGRVQDGEFCDIAIDPDRAGGCPRDCTSSDPCTQRELLGRGCQTRCVNTPITAPIDGDGCCPSPQYDASQDNDCGSCGDNIIGPGETCDPPESCPTEDSCTPTASCLLTTYSGSPETCDASCTMQRIDTCKPGDGCCPSSCDRSLDSDCSDRCGDGRVDVDAGETCEPTNPKAPCPDDCDDHDPCTHDLRVGSPDNCNVTCSHAPVAAGAKSDGCCPPGVAGQSDPDCKPDCGKNASSDPSCQPDAAAPTSHAEQCKADAQTGKSGLSAACSQCACAACSYALLQCYDSGHAERDATCVPAFECALHDQCASTAACYCGNTPLCSFPSGPCASEYEDAAMQPTFLSVQQCTGDPSCALYWSRQLLECLRTSCYSDCP